MTEQQPDAATDANADSSATTTRDEDTSASQLEESGPGDIGDDKLPDDLQPTEDNPLARHPGQTGEDGDKIGADVEGTDAANPSANMTYGSDDDDSNGPSDRSSNGSSDAPGESGNAQVKAEENDGSETLDNGGGGAG